MYAVISHGGHRHIDDTIGVAIYVAKGIPHATLPPQDVESIEAARERGAVLVDIGGVYDPDNWQFDHHHDASLPCAAVLVARKEWYDAFAASPAAAFMTAKDLRGFAAAVKETGHKPGPEAGTAEANLTSVKMTKEFATAIIGYLGAMRGDETYEEMILGLWDAAPKSSKAEADAAAKAKAEAEAKAIAAAHVVEVDGVKVVVGTIAMVAPVAFEAFPGADIVVCPNAMNAAHVSIVKDTRNEMASAIDLTKASGACGLSQIFVHNAGFIAVVAGRVEDIDVAALVRGVKV